MRNNNVHDVSNIHALLCARKFPEFRFDLRMQFYAAIVQKKITRMVQWTKKVNSSIHEYDENKSIFVFALHNQKMWKIWVKFLSAKHKFDFNWFPFWIFLDTSHTDKTRSFCEDDAGPHAIPVFTNYHTVIGLHYYLVFFKFYSGEN